MKRWLEKIAHAGVTPDMPVADKRCAMVANEAAIFVGVLILLYAFQPAALHHPLIFWTSIITALGFLAVPLILSSGRVLAGQIFFGVYAALAITWLAMLLGNAAHQHLFLITVALGSWMVFPESRRRISHLFTIILFADYLFFEFIRPAPLLTLSAAELEQMAHAAHIMLFLIVLAFAIYSHRRTNQAEAGLEEAHAKSEALLLNILPPSIARQLKAHRGAIADRFDQATILFADIVNFTTLSEGTSPVELVRMLDEVFTRFDQLAERYGLEKIKTIGDAYMVAGGIPVARQDHVDAVASMALDMIDVLKSRPGESGRRLDIRVGIHSGPVVAGVIGQRKFAYDLWGDSVNTASRMESHGLAGRIQVSAAVYEQLRERFVFEPRGMISIKGKGEQTTYFLIGKRPSGWGM